MGWKHTRMQSSAYVRLLGDRMHQQLLLQARQPRPDYLTPMSSIKRCDPAATHAANAIFLKCGNPEAEEDEAISEHSCIQFLPELLSINQEVSRCSVWAPCAWFHCHYVAI
jgi:hypothetical protein